MAPSAVVLENYSSAKADGEKTSSAKPPDYSALKAKEVEDLPNDEHLLSLAVQLERQCAKYRVDGFYSYYLLSHLKYLPKEKSELLLMREIDLVSRGKSYYHRVMELIANRERFLGILRQQIESYADDSVFEHVQQLAGESTNPEPRQKKVDNILASIRGVRLLNIELIEEVQKWKAPYEEIRSQAVGLVNPQPIIFRYRGQNYLLKMISDAGFVATCRVEGLTFSSGNDPFLLRPLKSAVPELAEKLQVDETLHPRIVQCLEVLAREKSDEFRFKLTGATWDVPDDKMGPIRSIYQAKGSKKPKLNIQALQQERAGNSFDEDDEFDSLVRRYEKEVLLSIKNKIRVPQKKAITTQVPEQTKSRSPTNHNSSQRLRLLRNDVEKLTEIRKESQEVKERIAETMKTQRSRPLITLVEEKSPEEEVTLLQSIRQLRSLSQPRLKNQEGGRPRQQRPNKNRSFEKANPDQLKEDNPTERSARQPQPNSNLDVWRSYSTIVDMRKKSLDNQLKMERQNKLIEELRERLKDAELENQKFTKYQNYVAQRRSKHQKSDFVGITDQLTNKPQNQKAQPEETSFKQRAQLVSPYRKRTPSVSYLKYQEDKIKERDGDNEKKEAVRNKDKEPEPQRVSQTDRVDEVLLRLRTKLKGKGIAPATERDAKAAVSAVDKRDQDIVDADDKRKIIRGRYEDIKKIYSQKQSVKMRDDTTVRPSEVDVSVLKRKIEDEMRQKILAEFRKKEIKAKEQSAALLKESEAAKRRIENEVREKLLAEMREGRRAEQAKKSEELERFKQMTRLMNAKKSEEQQQEKAKRKDQYEMEMLKNIKLQRQMAEEHEQLRKRMEEEAEIRELRLREQYEEQMRIVEEEYNRQTLQIKYRLAQQQQQAKEKQKRLELEEQERLRLEEELHRQQLREELLKEINRETARKSHEQQTEFIKLEMEKEMLRLRSKEEHMMLQLEQENLMKMEQLKKLRQEEEKANLAVKEQLKKLEEQRRERELEKQKQRLNNSSIIIEEGTKSLLEEESKLENISVVEAYSPEKQEQLKEQLKQEILRELQEREEKRRHDEQLVEEERKLKYQQLEEEYRKAFQEKRRVFEEELSANLRAEAKMREEAARQREESLKAARAVEGKLQLLEHDQFYSVEGKTRELLKEVESEEEGELKQDTSEHGESEQIKLELKESHIAQQIRSEPSSTIEIEAVKEPGPLTIDTLKDTLKVNIESPQSKIEQLPAELENSLVAEPKQVTEPQQSPFEMIQHRTEPAQPQQPTQPQQQLATKLQKSADLAESLLVQSPPKQEDKQIENFPSFPRNQLPTLPNNSSSLFQTQEDILRKWNQLRPHLRPSPRKLIEAHSINEFVATFIEKQKTYGMWPEMLPYSDKELHYILRKRQVDIFPNSLGWRDGEKYILLGNLECLGEVSDLYGNIQVEVRMNMNSANPREKRYFAGKLRFFETVGYVYQKRLEGDYFAIKVIIKIPRGLKVQRPRNNNRLNLECAVQMDGKSTPDRTRGDCSYIYMLAQQLLEYLTPDEKLLLAKYGQSNYITKELFGLMTAIDLHEYCVEGASFKQTKTENTTQLSLEIPVCLSTYPCLRFETTQIFNSQATYYISSTTCPGFTLMVVPLESPKLEFDLDTHLKVMRKEGKSKQTLLWVPMWKTQRRVRVDNFSTKPFIFRTESNPSFDIGSIFEQPKGNCVTVKPPFIFAVFADSMEKLCKCTPIYAEIVRAENLMAPPAMH